MQGGGGGSGEIFELFGLKTVKSAFPEMVAQKVYRNQHGLCTAALKFSPYPRSQCQRMGRLWRAVAHLFVYEL